MNTTRIRRSSAPDNTAPGARRDEQELDQRCARLREAYDPGRFAREAAQVTEQLRQYLERAADRRRPVLPTTAPETLFEGWPEPDEDGGASLSSLVDDLLEQSTSQHHPGFVGQQLSAPPPQAGIVAMVSAILNNSVAIFEGAPAAVALERRVVEWLAKKAGYGEGAGGTLTSGGTLGALTALLAVRQARMGSDTWSSGLAGGERCTVYVSAQAHYCNQRACAVLGLGTDAAVPVPTDARFKIDVRALTDLHRRTLSEGRRPVALVANAGSTSTGSHDDLPRLAAFCRENDLWLHVDAAHGGGALLSERYRGRLAGIELADSLVWDAHKMMLMPSLCTAVLFRDKRHLDAAFRQEASYLLADERPWYQPAARNFETTKPTMVFPLYVCLRTLGVGFFVQALDYAYDLALAFADEIERRDDFELLVPPESNIVCFRRRAVAGENSNDLQNRLRDAVNQRGRFFVQKTSHDNATWLRVVLMNPATRLSDLRVLLGELTQRR